MRITGPRMDYKFPGRNVAGIMGSEKLVDSGYKKPCYVLPAGRVGWRGVGKIRLAGIGSARRRKEVGLQSEVR